MDAANTSLPMLPVVPAAQVFRAQAQYVDLPGLSGIRYLTYYSQGISPLTATDILYVFQGLSADGQVLRDRYVHAAHAALPGGDPAGLQL